MTRLIIQDSEGNTIGRIPLEPGIRITTDKMPHNSVIHVSADEQGRLILEGGSSIISAIKGEGMLEKLKGSEKKFLRKNPRTSCGDFLN
jgi:hypothetical protein